MTDVLSTGKAWVLQWVLAREKEWGPLKV